MPAKQAPAHRLPNNSRARAQISALLTSIVANFERQHWVAIRSAFTSSALGGAMVSQLANWHSEGVRRLNARIADLVETAPRRYAVTIEFSSDPRAIPTFDVYSAVQMPHSVRLQGPTTGLRSTSLATAGWKVITSAHFRVFHSPYELRAADRRFLADLEHERSEFIQKFGIRPPPSSDYYFYPEQSLMRPFTRGACGTTAAFVGCTLPDLHPPQIHTSEWPSYHEPIHVFQIAMEPKGYEAPLFISEGMAVALEDRELDPRLSDYCSDLVYVPLDYCARRAAGGVHVDGLLSDAGFSKGDLSVSYLLSGSFVKYLLLRFGDRKFGRFYYVLAAQPTDKLKDYNVAARRVYGQAMLDLLAAWHGELCGDGRC